MERATAERAQLLDEINLRYKEQVKPIFEKKCLDCHSGSTRYPWYYKIPGIRSLIDDDIKEARKHMDLSQFPFEGHGSPEEDLLSIQEVINKETMPPWRYRIMHRGKKITEDERETIRKWIKESHRKLSKAAE